MTAASIDRDRQICERAAYIARWDGHLDTYFGQRLDPAGKSLLVIGSGWGSEILWALRRGATRVVGLDPGSDDRAPLELALADAGLAHLADAFTLHKAGAPQAGDIGTFDHALTNNAFEHVGALSANLAALERYLPHAGSRIFLFADPLFFSARGHHLPIGPWEHLSLSQADVRARVGPRQWRDYRDGLNGMTITDFLGAVREAGLILLDLAVHPERELHQFNAIQPLLPPGLKPMDLCLEGISCTLAFPRNL